MITQPIASVGNGDTAMSLAWQPRKSAILAMGTGSKLLKIFDLRENNSKRSAAPGLSVDAHRHGIISIDFDHERANCICTVGERDTHVKVWDMRRLTVPIVQLHTRSVSIVKARFHPTEQGVIALASRDNSIISLWNLKSHPESNNYFDKGEEIDNELNKTLGNAVALSSTNDKTKKIATLTFQKINSDPGSSSKISNGSSDGGSKRRSDTNSSSSNNNKNNKSNLLTMSNIIGHGKNKNNIGIHDNNGDGDDSGGFSDSSGGDDFDSDDPANDNILSPSSILLDMTKKKKRMKKGEASDNIDNDNDMNSNMIMHGKKKKKKVNSNIDGKYTIQYVTLQLYCISVKHKTLTTNAGWGI